MCVCMYVYVCMCVCMCVCVYMYVGMYVCVYVYMCVCMYLIMKFNNKKTYFLILSQGSQKSCLNQINLVAKSIRDVKIIPALPAGDFEVGQDEIHWTEATANKLYRSWMRYLNLNQDHERVMSTLI